MVNWVKVLKIVSTGLSIGGMALGAWADSKSNSSALEKLVKEYLSKK